MYTTRVSNWVDLQQFIVIVLFTLNMVERMWNRIKFVEGLEQRVFMALLQDHRISVTSQSDWNSFHTKAACENDFFEQE